MSEISPLTEQDVCDFVRILGEVAAKKPEPDRQRVYLMNELASLLGTDTWVWGVAPLLDPEKQPVYLFQNTGGMDDERMSRFFDFGALDREARSAFLPDWEGSGWGDRGGEWGGSL
jgi:hypothetical protein